MTPVALIAARVILALALLAFIVWALTVGQPIGWAIAAGVVMCIVISGD